MKNKALFTVFLFIALSVRLFAFGRGEAAQSQTQNDEWILCVTSFDVRSLPAQSIYLSEVITRKIVERLTSINYRTRISPEYTYYEEFAWANARAAAAKAIAAKHEERSALIYRGEADWRYRQNLARIDTDLGRLRAALEEIENNPPLINREPVFNLTRGNLDFIFPPAPEEGKEQSFCTTNRADGFLSGAISTFHGRYVLTVRLYTVYTRSFVWEDRIIFSLGDLDDAIEEFSRRLLIVLSGNQPAAVTITAEPEETLVLINRAFAGRGSTEVIEMPPGTITVTASAPNHETITFDTLLSPDELTVINLTLYPVRYVDLDILSSAAEGRVYHGALYVGDSPMTLRLPLNNLEYIEIETKDSQVGTAVFQTPYTSNYPQTLVLRPETPLQKGRVERERRLFYWSWGGTWIAGIAAWAAYYSYSEADKAIRSSYQSGAVDPDFHRTYMTMYYIHTGTLVVTGLAAAYSIYRIIRYLYTSNRGAIPLRTGRN